MESVLSSACDALGYETSDQKRCAQPGYLSDLGSRLSSSEWMASTGIPLFVTLLGLLIAYLFLAGQLRNDRALRLADHRREASTTLADSILTAMKSLPVLNEFVPMPLHKWLTARDILFEDIFRASHRLAYENLKNIDDIAEAVTAAWALCLAEAAEVEASDPYAHTNGVRAAVREFYLLLSWCAADLSGWDGEGPEPQLDRSFEIALNSDSATVLTRYRAGVLLWTSRLPKSDATGG